PAGGPRCLCSVVEGTMGDLASRSERRRALRVPVRGVAVFYPASRSEPGASHCGAEDGAMHGTIENLSSSGALVTVAGVPSDENLDVELKLGAESGWVSARTVRIERTARRWRVAVAFERIDDRMR